MSVFGKNPTAFWGTRKREQRIGKSFKSFIYFLICRNLWADWYRTYKITGFVVNLQVEVKI